MNLKLLPSNDMQKPPLTSRSSSCRVFEVACTSWAQPRSFNGHSFHRLPVPSPSKQDQELPLVASHRHHLCHAPAHSRTEMTRLLPQRGLDLFKIRVLHVPSLHARVRQLVREQTGGGRGLVDVKM